MASTKRKEQKAASRAKLMEGARALFAARGYEAVTIRGVAQAIGMSTGAVFSQIPDKEALFREAMGREPPMLRVREWLEAEVNGDAPTYTRDSARTLLADLFGAP